MPIFCDESGFTGEDLFSDDQPYFAYTTVALDTEEAADLVLRVRREFSVDGPELKGKKLLKYHQGRKAIDFLLLHCASRSKSVIHDKRYALAGKFFEYIFEPLLSEKISALYELGFHEFIANILYFEFEKNPEIARRILEEFQRRARGLSGSQSATDDLAVALFEHPVRPSISPMYLQILNFCRFRKDDILTELAHARDFGGPLLELSVTSLWSLLGHWGERFSALEVYCDESLALEQGCEIFRLMIGRQDKAYMTIRGRTHPLAFNLARPVELTNSLKHPGIQIADVLSSTLRFVTKNRHKEETKPWIKLFFEANALHDNSVFPGAEHIDMSRRRAALNSRILRELTRRAELGQDLLDQLGEFVVQSNRLLPPWLS